MIKKAILYIILLCLAIEVNAIDVLFRYDDYRLREDSLQSLLIETFAEEHIPLHIGVISFNADSTPILEEGESLERVKVLQQEGILQIAMHGYNHKGNCVYGEFIGKSVEDQRFRLESSSIFLDSVFGEHVHIFIPPWNCYDSITLQVLAELNYTIISSTFNTGQYVDDERFQYYPETVDHPAKLLGVIKRNVRRNGLVVCMFHGYDFSDSYTMHDLQELLVALKEINGVRIVTMDELYAENQTYEATRIRENLYHPFLSKITHTREVILPTKDAHRQRIWDTCVHILLVIIIAVIGLLIIRKPSWRYWVAEAISCALAAYLTWSQPIKPKYSILIICIIAIAIVCVNIFKKKHERG